MDRIPPVLGVVEMAELLALHEDVVSRMCKRGEIPAVKRAGRWRILREDFTAWLRPVGATVETVESRASRVAAALTGARLDD